MSEEDAFLNGIASDRADRTRLLVFADWLADRSDPREEFVRLHAKLLEMDGTEPEFKESEQEWKKWAAPESYPPGSAVAPLLSERWIDALCRVFTRDQAVAHLNGSRGERSTDAEERIFWPHEHNMWSNNDTLYVYHGKPEHFRSPFDFVAGTVFHAMWNVSPHAVNPSDPLPDILSPITRGDFWSFWARCYSGLENPPPLPVLAPDNVFLGGQYVRSAVQGVACIGLHHDDYFALYWYMSPGY